MTDEVPDIDSLPAKVAELHRNGLSPSGKYGFHVNTNQGRLEQDCTWTSTWAQCFSNQIRKMFDLEEASQGYDKEMARLRDAIMMKVIPRLLRPMESGSRSIYPRLLHGDLWDGNTSTDVANDSPIIFDVASFYGHNEYE